MDVDEGVHTRLPDPLPHQKNLGARFHAGRHPLPVEIGAGGIGAQVAEHAPVRVHVGNDAQHRALEHSPRHRVGAVEEASTKLGLTEIFVGVIVVAIIGNAAEHSTAVLVAMKNKMDLALNIAIGSSMQVALFVAPVLVFASYLFGQPMNLLFTPLEVVAVGVSVAIVALIAQDGESNWMEGVLLLAVYAILGITFFSLPA